MLALAAGTIAFPLVFALGPGSVDYVYARNFLPALLPLLVAAGVALATPRLLVVAGLAAAAGMAAVTLFASPSLHRADGRGSHRRSVRRRTPSLRCTPATRRSHCVGTSRS
jgi:hypothetical protein